MNVLTKVFVVLVTILSIVLVSLVIPFVANQENFRDQRDAARAEVIAANTQATLAKSKADASQTSLAHALSESQKLLEAEQRINDTLRGSEAAKAAEIESLKGAKARVEADFANLSAANLQMTAILASANAELQKRREENLIQGRQIIQLDAANNELEAAKATALRQARLANEQRILVGEELSELRKAYDAIPKTTAATVDNTVFSDVTIRAQVTDVRAINTDTTLVQLNVGSVGGVKENMKFLVHRGEEYLGTLVISNVDQQQSAGRLQTVKAGAKIQAGDQALHGKAGG